MWRIGKGLYLGDRRDAADRDMLQQAGITHVLNVAREVPCFHRSSFRYRHYKFTDPDPEFHEYIEKLCKFIHRGRRAGGILVHCAAGLSRSPATILAYLCWRGRALDEAMDLLARKVGEQENFVEPDWSFLEQIELYFEDREA